MLKGTGTPNKQKRLPYNQVIQKIEEENNIPRDIIETVLSSFIFEVVEGIAADRAVNIPNFGTFKRRTLVERKIVKDDKVLFDLPERHSPDFIPSITLINTLRRYWNEQEIIDSRNNSRKNRRKED